MIFIIYYLGIFNCSSNESSIRSKKIRNMIYGRYHQSSNNKEPQLKYDIIITVDKKLENYNINNDVNMRTNSLYNEKVNIDELLNIPSFSDMKRKSHTNFPIKENTFDFKDKIFQIQKDDNKFIKTLKNEENIIQYNTIKSNELERQIEHYIKNNKFDHYEKYLSNVFMFLELLYNFYRKNNEININRFYIYSKEIEVMIMKYRLFTKKRIFNYTVQLFLKKIYMKMPVYHFRYIRRLIGLEYFCTNLYFHYMVNGYSCFSNLFSLIYLADYLNGEETAIRCADDSDQILEFRNTISRIMIYFFDGLKKGLHYKKLWFCLEEGNSPSMLYYFFKSINSSYFDDSKFIIDNLFFILEPELIIKLNAILNINYLNGGKHLSLSYNKLILWVMEVMDSNNEGNTSSINLDLTTIMDFYKVLFTYLKKESFLKCYDPHLTDVVMLFSKNNYNKYVNNLLEKKMIIYQEYEKCLKFIILSLYSIY
ncbi:hypothetical protein TCON_1673 [Astathelohania contejeani]|uniref:Uncharacterized protein n=1 Tax=Astathelohania contejeani TaxID=164912 RepID=A0ABQ7HY35_9MICR|nr:hypothetical protein TCON_1673 [Thelohania contejeani]